MTTRLVLLITILTGGLNNGHAEMPVKITADIDKVPVKHNAAVIVVQRNQDETNTIDPTYAWTSRKCPPFCIQPMNIAPGIETIGELEILEYLTKVSDGDDSILVVDSRFPVQYKRGTIPGAINIPWTALDTPSGAQPEGITEILKQKFGVKRLDEIWDFSSARTLVLFCNGMWCGQSPTNIKVLLRLGYPAHKIKWYRGGMQDWEILGLTTISSAE